MKGIPQKRTIILKNEEVFNKSKVQTPLLIKCVCLQLSDSFFTDNMGIISMWSTLQHWPAGQVNEIKHKSTVYMQNTLEDSHGSTILALIILKQ